MTTHGLDTFDHRLASELVAAGLIKQVGALLRLTEKGREWRSVICGIDVDEEAERFGQEPYGCGSVAPPCDPAYAQLVEEMRRTGLVTVQNWRVRTTAKAQQWREYMTGVDACGTIEGKH